MTERNTTESGPPPTPLPGGGEGKPRRARRQGVRWYVVVLALIAAAVWGVGYILRPGWIQDLVALRLAESVERSTGLRAEWRSFSFDPWRLEVSVRGLTLHGRQREQEPPLFAADQVETQWNLISIWDLSADLTRLRILNPRIYIAVDDDGESNLPVPPGPPPGAVQDGAWLERLFSFQIRRLEVLRGELRWNDVSRPLNFRAENIVAALASEAGSDRFTGRLEYQDGALTLGARPPIGSRVRARFSLYPTRAEIESFEWLTEHSQLSGQGSVEDFRSPEVRLRYQLQLDLREAGDLLGSPGWTGSVQWNGEGGSSDAGWEFAGALGVQIPANGIPALRGVPWSAESDLHLTVGTPAEETPNDLPWRAQLEQLRVAALGGQLAGSASVESGARRPQARFDLNAERVSLPAILRLASTARYPVEQLGWGGMVSGSSQVAFEGAGENLRISGDWQVEPPQVVPQGFVPVSGALRGGYQASYQAAGPRVEMQALELNLPQTRLRARGWLDAQDSELDLGIETTRLEEPLMLARLMGAKFDEPPVKLQEQGGRADAQILWTGGGTNPELGGRVNLAGFSYQNNDWDEFSGAIRYRRAPGEAASGATELEVESGRLVQGPASAEFRVRVRLQDNALDRGSPFFAEGAVHQADIAELQRLLGTSYPVTGTLQAAVQASGTPDDPHGEGTVTIENGSAYNEPFDRLTAQLAAENRDAISASRFRVERGQTVVAGSGAVNRKTEEFRFTATGANVELSELDFLQTGRMALSGVSQIALAGEGTRSRPTVRGNIEIGQLRLNGEETGAVSLGVETRERQVVTRGTVRLFGTDLRISGETRLEEPFATTARVEFADIEIGRMIRAVREAPENLTGLADGMLAIEGDLRHPEALLVRGDLSRLEATLRDIEFRASSPVRFRYQNQQVRLEQLHVSGPSLDLEATGNIQLGEDPALNLIARGNADLSTLPRFDPELEIVGRVTLDAVLGGTIGRPIWRGNLRLADGSVEYENLSNSLTAIQGTVVFDGNRGFLENFTAESGGGPVRLSGFFAYESEPGLRVQLTADVNDVRVRYPAGVSTVLGGRLTLSGTTASSLLGGQLVIQRESISPNFDLARALAGSRGAAGATTTEGFLRNMRLDLEVTSAPDIRLETSAARNLQGDVELRIRGTVERPVLLGRIGIQEGELSFAGKRYTVSRGEVTFANPFRIEPILNLSVQARVQQYDISMDFIGPPDRLTLTYRSDPPLPTRDILALLVAGSSSTSTGDGATNQPVPELGASSLLSQALTAQIGNRLDRLFGAGRIRVDPQLSGLDRPLDASVAFEQQISDNLTVTYITNVASVREQIIRGEWAISQRYSLAAVRDQNGLVGVNLQMTLRFR